MDNAGAGHFCLSASDSPCGVAASNHRASMVYGGGAVRRTRPAARRTTLTTSPESLLAQLRAATSALHGQLDAALGLQDERITRESYAAFLRGSLAALAPLEVQLRPWLPADEPPRCDLLRSDLLALGVAADVPALPDVPPIDSPGAAWGARYVIEGSALGGVVLARAFDARLGLRGEAVRYLTLHGAGLAQRWRSFLIDLEEFGKTATAVVRSDACETAKAVFNLYSAGLRSSEAIAART